ncbi:MAG: poly(A) polymerase [Pelagibacterales bacterium]|nr:poly(A) polymerase [Pelagibacterales bacterium]
MKKYQKMITIKKIKNFFSPFYKSKEIKEFFDLLEKDKPKDKQVAMFVGGCVRKFYSNEDIDDIDVATIFSPIEIKEKLKNSSFRIIDTGIEHGTLTVVKNNFKIEITTLRQDVETDGRHAKIKYTEDWILDSERRDFTINSIYLDIRGKIFDPQSGLSDLKNKVVKFIGNPERRIEEDYLRIIRFIRFSIQYNFDNIENKTIDAIKLNLNNIKKISKERVFSELLKILKLNNFNFLLSNKELYEIFIKIFPELKYLERLEKLSYFPSTNYLKRDLNFILAILLIDQSDNHEYFCFKYKTSNRIKGELLSISKNYIRFKNEKNFLDRELKKNLYHLKKENLIKLLYLVFCSEEKFSLKLFSKKLEEISKISIPNFPYDGQFLIQQGLIDGNKIGTALNEIKKTWVNNNFYLEKEEAFSIVAKFKN